MYLVEIAFGHCRADGTPLPRSAIQAQERLIMQAFGRLFRGGQLYYSLGSYCDCDEQAFTETSSIIRAYAQDIDSCTAQLERLARRVALALEQDSVMLVIVQLTGSVNWVSCRLPESSGARSDH